MMMWVNLLPTVVTKSDKQVLETALLELQDEGWKNKIKLLFLKLQIKLITRYFCSLNHLLN